jgi:hypothetical protein
MNDGGPGPLPTEYYWGSLAQVAGGVTRAPDPIIAGSPEACLDVGRSEGVGLRSRAVWAASSIRDATAIAAIRSYSRTVPVPHEAIHVYRVDLHPFHLGPVGILDEVRARLETAAGNLELLVRQYWEPTGTWHIQEFLAPSMKILEEVPAATERDVYIRRWVQYNLDRERAAAL